MNDLVLAVLPLLVNFSLETFVDAGLRFFIDEEEAVRGSIGAYESSNISSILEVSKIESLFQVEFLLTLTEFGLLDAYKCIYLLLK